MFILVVFGQGRRCEAETEGRNKSTRAPRVWILVKIARQGKARKEEV